MILAGAAAMAFPVLGMAGPAHADSGNAFCRHVTNEIRKLGPNGADNVNKEINEIRNQTCKAVAT
jgi:hypothetical protein